MICHRPVTRPPSASKCIIKYNLSLKYGQRFIQHIMTVLNVTISYAGNLEKMNDTGVVYPSYIANCVLNALTAYTAIVLNIVTIHAMRKTSSLPNLLKVLLLSLAVSDLGVGLVVQPFYIAWLVKRIQQNSASTVSNPGYTMDTVFFTVMNLFSCASFFNVLALSVDRFLAIHLHLRYREFVTYKRVVVVVVSIWVFSAFFSSIKIWTPKNITESLTVVVALLFGLCIMCTTVIYYRIYLIVRRHRQHIQSVHEQLVVAQNDEISGEISREISGHVVTVRKSAVGTFYVYLVFMFCYMPGYCMMIARMIASETNIAMKKFDPYAWTLVFVNSSLNPVIYCWKMRNIRQAIMDMLRSIVANRIRGNPSMIATL